MTDSGEEATELNALRELADEIFESATEPLLDLQQVSLGFDPALWRTLEESGLTLLTTPEDAGGSGASLYAAAAVLESAGFHSAPAPLAETDLLSSWALRSVGLSVPIGPLTIASTPGLHVDGSRLTAEVDNVPWAPSAVGVVLAGDDFVAYAPAGSFTVAEGRDIAGQPSGLVRIDVELNDNAIAHTAADVAAGLMFRGALARSLQTCGALARAVELSVAHVGERVQFGRPIARFQAVQALIAGAAGSIAMAKAATDHAVATTARLGFDADAARFAIASAKIETARAATLVSRNAHQAHGAIGFTLDHRLRHFTTRALAWRSEFGAQREWELRLGRQVLTDPDTTVWEFVTNQASTTP